MIFESTELMVLMDLAFVGLAAAGLVSLISARNHPLLRSTVAGPMLSGFGLLIVALFYAADLAVMLGLPLVTEPAEAMRVMQNLHLNIAWPVNLAAGGFVLAGLVSSNRSIRGILSELSEQRSRSSFYLQRLQAISQQSQTAREEERAEISRELHDQLGQSLTGLQIKLSRLKDEVGDEEGALAGLADETVQLANDNLRFVRDLCSRIRPPVLDTLGLAAALEWMADELNDDATIRVFLDIPADNAPRLDEAVETAAFRIAQESLTNVIRHAQASRVELDLRLSEARLALAVRDDGVGIRQEERDSIYSMGLIGMQERARSIGASMGIEPRPEGGTVVWLTVPLPGQVLERVGPRELVSPSLRR